MKVTLDVPPEFASHCAARMLTPAQVLAAFMADLGETAASNGSDERARAQAWFDRVVWAAPDDGYDLSTAPADQLAEVLDLILWDMGGEKDAAGMLAELKARPDVATPEVQAAIAVVNDYLASPEG